MYLFFGLILLLPMLALKRREETDGSILDAKSTTCIKGILCIYVMLHNLGLDLDNSTLKQLVCEHSGGVGVGVFFFLSAYGIIRSYQAKGNKYLKKLLLIHIPKMWIVAVFINAITYLSFFRGRFETKDMWLRILNLDLFNGFVRINRHGWYITTICALYLAFAIIYFLCSKLKTKHKYIIACVALSAATLLFRDFAQMFETGGTYTREIRAFLLGCVYATFYEQINNLASKYFRPALLISVVVFIVGFLYNELTATYAAVAIVVLVSQKFTYYSKITFFLGQICLGVYLFLHYSSLVLWDFFLDKEYLWVLLNAGFIIEAAIAIYGVQYGFSYGIGLIKKKTGSKQSSAKSLADAARK